MSEEETEIGSLEQIEAPEALMGLNEGLGGWVMDLAAGGYDKQIKGLEKEVADIRTPEQQVWVLNKIAKILTKAIRVRHGQQGFRRFVHDNSSAILRTLGSKDAKGNPLPEMDSRLREVITDISRLRDKVLNMKLRGTDQQMERIEKAKKDVTDSVEKAAGMGATDSDYGE